MLFFNIFSYIYTVRQKFSPSCLRNSLEFWKMEKQAFNELQGDLFRKKHFGRGIRELLGEINFKISTQKVGLEIHHWKGLFKKMNLM